MQFTLSFLALVGTEDVDANKTNKKLRVVLALVIFIVCGVFFLTAKTQAVQQSQSGAVGVVGTIPSAAPTTAPVITVPSNGQVFNKLPIRVAGLCTNNLLVTVFKNNVFAGSVECVNGSFSLQIDLFDGQNTLVARMYDNLNQAGPNSKPVTVTFNNALPVTPPRVSITSSFTKIGADPGATLNWPVTISGGSAPYAVSVDWGDGSQNDLISQEFAGNLTLQHIYQQAGIYNIVVKVSDASGDAAFLQIVGIGNGPIQQSTTSKSNQQKVTERVVIWWPFIILFILIALAFWLGERHQLEVIRERLRRGERPFK